MSGHPPKGAATLLAVAYLQVSSEKQADEDRFGYHREIGGVTAYGERAGLELVGEYRDAITGKSVSRKAHNQPATEVA